MKLRVLVAVVCFGILPQAQASSAEEREGWLITYPCYAEEVNTAAFKHCSTQFPDLASRSTEAYKKWLRTNKARAATAKNICLQQLSLPSGGKDITPSERRDSYEKVRKLLIDDILKGLKANRHPEARCKEIITDMERNEPEKILDDMIKEAKKDRRIKVDD